MHVAGPGHVMLRNAQCVWAEMLGGWTGVGRGLGMGPSPWLIKSEHTCCMTRNGMSKLIVISMGDIPSTVVWYMTQFLRSFEYWHHDMMGGMVYWVM